jgi:O-antigen/teichoic acid export membrane protein
MSTLKEKIRKSKFGKNILIIAGGTAFAQVLGIIFSPIITRIYPPEQYGVLTAYTAVLGLLVISASLDYQKAIPIAEDDNKAINLLVLSLISLFSVVVFVTSLLYLWGDFFLSVLDSEVLSSYKYLIPIGVLFAGLYNIVLQWGFRTRNYKVITRTKVSQSLTSNLIKIGLGLLNIGPIGLIIGTITGQSAGITSLSIPLLKKRSSFVTVNFKSLKYVLKRYKKFPLYSAPSNYVYTASNNLPVILLVSLFDSTITGFFGLAKSITYLPISLIGNSISQVFYSESAHLGNENPKEIKRLSISLMKKIAIVAAIPLLVLLFFGPILFSFVFGKEWYDAGIYARLLSIMVYFHIIITPIGRVLEIFERQREGLALNIVRLVLVACVFLVSKIMGFSSYITVGLYSISNAVTYIILLILVLRILDHEIKRVDDKLI